MCEKAEREALAENPKAIWLSPNCGGADCFSERTWCEDSRGTCEECGRPETKYIRADETPALTQGEGSEPVGWRDALEAAAKVCDDYGREGDGISKAFECETADELAARIRALKPPPLPAGNADPHPQKQLEEIERATVRPGDPRMNTIVGNADPRVREALEKTISSAEALSMCGYMGSLLDDLRTVAALQGNGEAGLVEAAVKALSDSTELLHEAEVHVRLSEHLEREAFSAGWKINALGHDTHSQEYLDGCEEVDWQEYIKSRAVDRTAPSSPPDGVREAVEASTRLLARVLRSEGRPIHEIEQQIKANNAIPANSTVRQDWQARAETAEGFLEDIGSALGMQDRETNQHLVDRISAFPSPQSQGLVEAAEWQPIESAPKTDTDTYIAKWFVAWCPDPTATDGGDVRVCWWEPTINGGCWYSDRGMEEKPSHWWNGKLPAPPRASDRSA